MAIPDRSRIGRCHVQRRRAGVRICAKAPADDSRHRALLRNAPWGTRWRPAHLRNDFALGLALGAVRGRLAAACCRDALDQAAAGINPIPHR